MRNLSLRYKVPLRVGILILIVAVVVTTSLIARSYLIFKKDLVVSSENIALVTARTVRAPMLRNDVWTVYEIINAPFEVESGAGALQADAVIVLDDMNHVFVSTRPTAYPIDIDPFENNGDLGALKDKIIGAGQHSGTVTATAGSGDLYVMTPIISDGVILGRILMRYPDTVYTTRFASITKQAVYTTMIIVALLLPVGWYWGQRLAEPLVDLSRSMQQVGTRLPDRVTVRNYGGKDEIGRLGTHFQEMVDELRDKQQLEKRVLVVDRLAAIGRFSAGIAHEINNPLGGLLNATDTLKTHGSKDQLTQKTVSLLERGLMQLKQTVGALLVEASPEIHKLTPQDVEDTRTLILPSLRRKHVRFEWQNELRRKVDLPSTHVRQILINLLLNAAQAVPERGNAFCGVTVIESSLQIRTWNEGSPISDEALERLFEPYSGSGEGSRGLGLWVTYQIMNTLQGSIEVSSDNAGTEFVVMLPLIGCRDAA